MDTRARKPTNLRRVIMLLGPALPLALMLGLAAMALVQPAAASAQTSEAHATGTLYEGCDLQIYVSEPMAGKPDGDKQPVDLSVVLTDDWGNPIEGAKVLARVTDFVTHVDATLPDMGHGRYSACAFGYFSGSGQGALAIHVRAQKEGYTPGSNDGTNQVGGLCATPDPGKSN